MNFPEDVRVIELADISLQDNKDIITIKNEKDFKWFVGMSGSVLKLKNTYYMFDSESVYVFQDAKK